MRRIVVAAFAAGLMAAAPAAAQLPLPEVGGVVPAIGGTDPENGAQVIAELDRDTKRLRFSYGPVVVPPGGNLIVLGPFAIDKPLYDGYMTRFKPDLVRADGSIPPVDVVHLHHAVWLNASRNQTTDPNIPFDPFAASGEEKTILQMPPGYGYPVKATDTWIMNHMLHNQATSPETLWITYEIDYVRADSAKGRAMKPVTPIWMDVRRGETYPVYDVKRDPADADGTDTYPKLNSYGAGTRRNRWTAPRAGTLVSVAGHVHPGGLRTDLDIERGAAQRRAFRSTAVYFDPKDLDGDGDLRDGPPTSWDMAMTHSPPNWSVAVKAGDTLAVSATYDNQRASWYESMGIMVAYMHFEMTPRGVDPFAPGAVIPTTGEETHGHYAETDNLGGAPTGLPDPRTLPDGQTINRWIGIGGFQYLPGGFGLPGAFGNPPVVTRGQSLTFDNADAAAQVYHSITECRAPCTASTGLAFPLADGDSDFDSGQLGYGPTGFTAAKNNSRYVLSTAALAAGTYTYFCRIHPIMRGSFRVK